MRNDMSIYWGEQKPKIGNFLSVVANDLSYTEFKQLKIPLKYYCMNNNVKSTVWDAMVALGAITYGGMGTGQFKLSPTFSQLTADAIINHCRRRSTTIANASKKTEQITENTLVIDMTIGQLKEYLFK